MQKKREYSTERYSSRTFKIERFGVTNLVGLCDDGELKYTVEWLWEDSDMPLDEWVDTIDEKTFEEDFDEFAKKHPEKVFVIPAAER